MNDNTLKTREKCTDSATASWARVWRFERDDTVYLEVYTLAMAKFVHVQVHGVDASVKIAADEVKEEMSGVSVPHRLKLALGGKPVGEFKFDCIDGWWIEDQPPVGI